MSETEPKPLNDWDREWQLAQPYVFLNENQDQPKDWNKPKTGINKTPAEAGEGEVQCNPIRKC